jgi:hypothetical protein
MRIIDKSIRIFTQGIELWKLPQQIGFVDLETFPGINYAYLSWYAAWRFKLTGFSVIS